MSRSGAATIYEKHIRSLAPEERLELLALIARELAAEGVPSESKPRHNLMELHGLGKGVWEGIDAQEYVNKLRDGWDKQPS
jgi:hypothetical protein